MKNLLFLVFTLLTVQVSAQQNNAIFIEGLLGVRLNLLPHQDRGWSESSLITAPMIGVKIKHKEYPLALSFLHDRSILFRHFPTNESHDIREINIGNMLRLQYEAKKFRYGIGHYWFLQENWGNFFLWGPEPTIRYVAFTFAIPFGRAEIEFQSLIRYTLFDIGDRYLQELNFKYHFGGQNKKEQIYGTKLVSLNLLIGGRFFLPDQAYTAGERKAKVGTMASIGVEVLAEKYRTGIYWEKDWWIALNGGSPAREVKGLITGHTFGLKYHHPLKKDRSLNLGLGYTWMMDFSTLDETRNKIIEGLESRDLFENNIHGISIAPSFDFNKNFRMELRQIIGTRGEKGFDLERLSLGMFYRIWP